MGGAESECELAAAAETLLTCAVAADGGDEETAPLARALRRAARRLAPPLRLAVAGQIKRGKSTLVNALLGEEVALTGQLELTYTVSELHYDEQRSVTVHHRDGTSRALPAAEFRRMTARADDAATLLGDVTRVEYGMPNHLLLSFRLADTPGLGSVHGLDSRGTQDYLGISAFAGEAEQVALRQALAASGRTAQDVHRDSAREIERADAVLYLFDRGLHERDRAGVRDFLGDAGSRLTPLNAFGVLSRCDQQWPPGSDLPGDPDPLTWDPMEVSARIAERYLERPEVRSLFFTVLPVSGLLGAGARLLTDEELGYLDDLRGAEPRVLVRRLRDAGRFTGARELKGVPLPAVARRALVERLGIWGVHLACGALRDGATEEQLRARLLAASGVERLRDLIVRHFGNRAALIKLDHGVRAADKEIARLRRAAGAEGRRPGAVAGGVAADLERLRARTAGFAELNILSAHYRGELRLSADETRRLLAITGEYGTTLPRRLGLPDAASHAELHAAALAAVHAWATREQDPTLDRHSLLAVRAVRRSCERLLHGLRTSGDDGSAHPGRTRAGRPDLAAPGPHREVREG
ncbi:dynamin family protein [Streptomyces alboflavus]|uniref:dynamin family protein n=1 Tax=Streptomyces alboflavus TaxID=67267 RepID=UPI0004C22671|nr:dynamin family protein [Streptomyces alboflavus]